MKICDLLEDQHLNRHFDDYGDRAAVIAKINGEIQARLDALLARPENQTLVQRFKNSVSVIQKRGFLRYVKFVRSTKVAYQLFKLIFAEVTAAVTAAVSIQGYNFLTDEALKILSSWRHLTGDLDVTSVLSKSNVVIVPLILVLTLRIMMGIGNDASRKITATISSYREIIRAAVEDVNRSLNGNSVEIPYTPLQEVFATRDERSSLGLSGASVGFELEMLIGSSIFNGYEKSARELEAKLLRKLGVKVARRQNVKNWHIKPDWSLPNNGVELITPGFENAVVASVWLEKLLNLMLEDPSIVTNARTGLHMTFGGPQIEKINKLKLLFALNDERVLKTFDRENNKYTKSSLKAIHAAAYRSPSSVKTGSIDNKIQFLSTAVPMTKYYAVHFKPPKFVEFRGAGSGYAETPGAVRACIDALAAYDYSIFRASTREWEEEFRDAVDSLFR